jgi:hypothetical protein
MKNFAFKIMLCLGCIMLGCFAVSAAGYFDIGIVNLQTIDFAGVGLAIAAVGAGVGSITHEMLNDIKLKLGENARIKILTVVVEPDVLDIDNLSLEVKMWLLRHKIDASIVTDTKLPIEKRLVELSKLNDLTDTDKPDLTGKVIQEGEKYYFIVKRPDKSLIKMLKELANGGDLEKFSDALVKNLVIGGDMDALDDGMVYIGVIGELRGMIAPEESFLSNA